MNQVNPQSCAMWACLLLERTLFRIGFKRTQRGNAAIFSHAHISDLNVCRFVALIMSCHEGRVSMMWICYLKIRYPFFVGTLFVLVQRDTKGTPLILGSPLF